MRETAGAIAAIVGVKDEVELIGASIEHLRRIGVDEICVVDYGSTDGTLDVVAAQARRGDVSLSHVDPDLVVDYETSSAHDLAIARRTGAEWVLVLDADEFWLPSTGLLRTCGAMCESDLVVADRYNVVLTPRGLLMPGPISPAQYNEVQLLTRREPHLKQFSDANPDVPFITLVPGCKAMGRLSHAATITPGGHDLAPAAPTSRKQVSADVLVAHVPFSTWPRFARKVANIREELQRHPALFAGDYAWHWRKWAELDESRLHREFERQIASPARLAEWRAAGQVRSAAEVLGRRSEK